MINSDKKTIAIMTTTLVVVATMCGVCYKLYNKKKEKTVVVTVEEPDEYDE